jgi:hypothetical protein
MSHKLSPIINPEDLLQLKDASEFVLIDARAESMLKKTIKTNI